MRNPLLSVVGPTATGKTQFAFDLAEVLKDQFHLFDLISADSRQVFQQMEIGTGADIPFGFTQHQVNQHSLGKFLFPFYKKEMIRIHGVSIEPPDKDWSVAQFRDFAQKIMTSAWLENNLPIIVGGTGLYHQHIFTTDQQLEVPPNEAVREHADRISLANLQRWLKDIDANKFESMNNSDRHNPRRIVRAIEIALAEDSVKQTRKMPIPSQVTEDVVRQLMIGLTDSIENITKRIEMRIKSRLGQGMLEEVQKLIVNYDEHIWRGPAFSATGYKEVRSYLEDKLTYQQMQELWLRHEVQYAKRQQTWWKKQNAIVWFDVSEKGWQKEASETVKKWLAEG